MVMVFTSMFWGAVQFLSRADLHKQMLLCQQRRPSSVLIQVLYYLCSKTSQNQNCMLLRLVRIENKVSKKHVHIFTLRSRRTFGGTCSPRLLDILRYNLDMSVN